MGGDLVGDDALTDVVLVRQAEVFLGRDVAKHRGAVPADHRGADGGRDVVIARGDVGGERSERVERGLVAPLQLLVHVLLDHVHRHVAGAFVHDLHAALPGAGGELALRLEFGELGIVIGVGDGTGTEAVADREADVIGGHDVADVVPVGVEEVLLMVREAPLGHDRAATGDDAGDATRGHRDVGQTDAGMDREVVDALLGLFDERVAEDLPGEVFGAAVDLLEGLIDRHGADRDGAITQDPLAGLVDVLAGGEVHQGVASPLDGPAHLLDLFLDGGSHGRVADVGVDLHQEVAADDHRLELGVIDVGRDDGAAAGDFGTDELGGDHLGDRGAEGLALVLEGQVMAAGRLRLIGGEAHVLADGDVLHLRGDDALLGVGQLGRTLPRLALIDLAVGAIELDEAVTGSGALGGLGVLPGKVTVVFRLQLTAGDGFDVAALEDPSGADGRQALLDVAMEGGVAPGAGRIIDADWLISRLRAVGAGSVGQLHLAHRHEEVRT